MKVRIASDLHLEQFSDAGRALDQLLLPPDSQDSESVLILAGDITTARHLAAHTRPLIETASRFRRTLYVPGNHEFYHGSFDEVSVQLHQAFDHSPIRVLERDDCLEEIDGVRFVGQTLWTDYDKNDWFAKARAKVQMGDFYAIKGLSPVRVYDEHIASVQRLRDHLGGRKGDVVISHHGCHPLSIHDRFKGEPLNCAFVSDLSALMAELQPQLWVHGHVHNSFDYRVGECRVVVNPHGYISHGQYENEEFDYCKIIEVTVPQSAQDA